MPDEKNDLFNYSRYFTKSVPNFKMQVLLLVIAGAISVAIPFMIAGLGHVLYAAAIGIFIVSIPALFTVATIKIFKRSIPIRHIMIIALVASGIYVIFVFISASIILLMHNQILGYVVLLVGNAAIFGYWLLMDKVVIGMKKSASILAAAQPLYSILFYAAVGSSAINVSIPINILITKLVAGMLVFFVLIYVFIYLIDKPMKKAMNVSSVKIFTMMLNQWLYNTGSSDLFPEIAFGVKKDINVDVVVLKGKKNIDAIFVKPDIHFGPFKNVGGAVTTEVIGSLIEKKYSAVPFIMHGAVNAADNPVSTSETYKIATQLRKHLDAIKNNDFEPAKGGIFVGKNGPCKAINLKINDSRIVILTKAPLIVEDIEKSVGAEFKKFAEKNNVHAIIVDAHNTRFEFANKKELRGIYKNSPYIKMYKKAIQNSLKMEKTGQLKFGGASKRISSSLPTVMRHQIHMDIGNGPTSVGIFESSGNKFGIINFDANNMLPDFRKKIIDHLYKKFDIDFELLTTDTHSVNTVNLPVSNVLGSKTKINEILPIIDNMVANAISNIKPVSMHSSTVTLKGFQIWGVSAEKQITKISRELVKKTKYVIPLITLIGIAAAAVLIYMI
jgi:putative membrane protein